MLRTSFFLEFFSLQELFKTSIIIMFTANRSLLRNSSIRRNYQFSQHYIKSYLTPTTSSSDNSSADPNPTLNANISIDAATSLRLNSVDANEFPNNLNPNLYGTSNIDSPMLQITCYMKRPEDAMGTG
jgi:hypothetical protein